MLGYPIKTLVVAGLVAATFSAWMRVTQGKRPGEK